MRVLALALGLVLLVSSAGATREPLRIATLVPSARVALERMPDRARVVASVRENLREAVASGIVDLGTAHAPSFDALASSGAALVVGDRLIHAALAQKLERTSDGVLLIDTSSIDSTLAGLEELGRRIGAEPQMAREIEITRAELSGLSSERAVPTLALFGMADSFLAVTSRSWLGDLIRSIGFRNVASSDQGHERFPGYVQLSDEALVGLAPQLVLLLAHGDPQRVQSAFQARVDLDGPWRELREQASLGVHVLDPALFDSNPGLELGKAARALLALLSDAEPPR